MVFDRATCGLLAIFLVAFSLVDCGPARSDQRADVDWDWWKHAVVYQIYPRSFKVSFETKVLALYLKI